LRLVESCHLEPYRSLWDIASPQGFIDTGIDVGVVTGYGRIYIAETELREAANLYGYDSPETATEKDKRIAELERRVVELETDLADAQPVLSALARAATKFGGDVDDDAPRKKAQPRKAS
jgi:hypothetical protein